MGVVDKLTKAIDGIQTGFKEGFEPKRGNEGSENPATPGFWEKTASEVLAGVISGLVKRYGKREEAPEKLEPSAKKATNRRIEMFIITEPSAKKATKSRIEMFIKTGPSDAELKKIFSEDLD